MQAHLRHGIAKRSVQLLFVLLLTAACLFLSAGRWNWSNAWVLLTLYILVIVANGAILVRTSPALIAERASFNANAKAWDKVLAPLMALYGPMAIWIAAGLDARNHWSYRLPLVAVIAGAAIIVAGYVVVSWAMFSNQFFSGLVRIQTERGHTVAAAGPYRYVRHPGYVGVIAITMATPLLLNSLVAFIPAAITTAIAVLRTALEDRTLHRELDGYTHYAARVRHRLVPGLW
jgi:protein-S-isoprenylcysteine O-methyltransferase Ste14